MIKAIISDFDGTIVDTFEANLKAYQQAFSQVGLILQREDYEKCFGYRFDQFMNIMGVVDEEISTKIKEIKTNCYPCYFSLLKLNKPLIEFIKSWHLSGFKTALASTARRDNVLKILDHFKIMNVFDIVYTGYDVINGKPSPEIYLKSIDALGVKADEVLIFEDSSVGIDAAKASGAYCMIVDSRQFE